jgi:hypothetical protein
MSNPVIFALLVDVFCTPKFQKSSHVTHPNKHQKKSKFGTAFLVGLDPNCRKVTLDCDHQKAGGKPHLDSEIYQ